METVVFIVRHCEAMGNKSGTFQGSIDSDITDIGARQLDFLAERFADIKLDKVYSSPLLRAYKTAEAVGRAQGLPIVKYDPLTEIDGGDIEGMTYADIYTTYPEIEETWTYAPQNFAPPKGESMRDAYERIFKAVFTLAKENKGKTIAIASHGAVIRCLLCAVTEGNIERLNNVTWCDNTSVTKLVFDDDMNCSVEFINDTTHLPDEYLPSGSRIASYIQREEK